PHGDAARIPGGLWQPQPRRADHGLLLVRRHRVRPERHGTARPAPRRHLLTSGRRIASRAGSAALRQQPERSWMMNIELWGAPASLPLVPKHLTKPVESERTPWIGKCERLQYAPEPDIALTRLI